MSTENTYYDNDESTRLEGSDNANSNGYDGQDTVYADDKGGNSGVWKKVTIGGITGLMLGVGVSYLTAATTHTGETAANGEEGEGAAAGDDEAANSSNPLVDSEMSLAANVSDDMSFSQAFAAARAEVGAGGAFEWHGNIYSTYYAEEWDGMSADAKDEYNSHFAWNNGANDNGPSADIASSTTHTSAQPHTTTHTAADDNTGHTTQTTTETSDTPQHDIELAAEPKVHVLGVVHDDEHNVNIAGLNIDGQEHILVDFDNDLTFDNAVSDLNGDGRINPQNEVIDISQASISVEDLGGFTDGSDDLYANNDEGPDYVNDGDVYDA